MKYAKIENYNKDNFKLNIAFVLIAIFTMISFFYFFKFVFDMSPFQIFSVYASGINNSKIVVGQATKNIIGKIKITGFNPVVVANVKRNFFSSPGQIMTLGGDNIEVFEYSDNGTALADISLFKKSSETRIGSWKKNINLYESENLIVFYMGQNNKIINLLNDVLGQRFVL